MPNVPDTPRNPARHVGTFWTNLNTRKVMAEETDKIVCFDERPHSFNLPDTDFKAEVVASGLKESGYDAERTLISRLGDIRRGFSKDIHDAHSEYSQYDLTDYLYLYVNRRSIYDTLPEGIFHKNLYQSDKSSKEQILDEIRIHRDEEFYARRFFKPFEITLDYMLVSFQNKERRIDEMNVHPDFVSIFSDQWPVLKLLPVHLAIMLIRMLAYMEQITVNPSKISECMSMLTGVPIRLQKGEKSVVEADPHLVPKLGECLLGDTMVLGNRFADGTYQMLLEIGPLPAQKMETLFSDTIDRQILCDLMDLFLPADKEIQVRYIIQQEDAQFKLGNPTEQGAYLGISTYL